MKLNKALASLQPEFQAYAWAVCRDEEDAKDLLQNAFCRAMSTQNPPRDMGKLKAWMFRIIRNLHLDDLRKKKVRREYQARQARLEDIETRHQPDFMHLLQLQEAFSRLPPEKREIIYLVDMAGMTYAETADVMDIPQGTVMSRISRARRELIGLLEGEDDDLGVPAGRDRSKQKL